MTFEDAADAYEMIQSGLSIRKAARVIGMSHTRLGQIIKSCLEHGKDAPALTFQRGGTPIFSLDTLKAAGALRREGHCWKTVGRMLSVDPDQLAPAYRYYDRGARKHA
jgi:hypothetical protein